MHCSSSIRALAACLILALAAPAALAGGDADPSNLSPLQRLALEAAKNKASGGEEEADEQLPEGVRSMTNGPRMELSPCWAPDSETLYYTQRDGGMGKIMRLDPGEAEGDSIVGAQWWHCEQPAISPDGKYLAYRNKKAGQLSIWIMRLEDGQEGKLPPEIEPREVWPIWNASGMGLFYERQLPAAKNSQAVSILRTGESQKFLSEDRGTHSFPRVSPDGKHVAWLHQWQGMWKILVVNTEIAAFRQEIPIRGWHVTTYDWLPDGRHMVVAANDESKPAVNFDIAVLDMDTGEIRSVLDLGQFDGEPRLSPDGTKVVFQSDMRGQYDLFVWDLPEAYRGAAK